MFYYELSNLCEHARSCFIICFPKTGLPNFIERAVILSPGRLLEIPPLAPGRSDGPSAKASQLRMLEAVERGHIRRQRCCGDTGHESKYLAP